MNAVDRRSAMRSILSVAVCAGFIANGLLNTAEAMPLALEKTLGRKADDLKEMAQDVVTLPPRGSLRRPHAHRHPPREHCWWRRGRHVCVWR
jgi:hypothetical protein